MSVRKIDGVWYVDVRWRGRRYRKKSPANHQAGAHAFELRVRQQLEGSGFLPASARSRSLQAANGNDDTFAACGHEWFSTYVQATLRPSTRRGYGVALRRHLLPALGHLPLRSITPREIEAFKVAQRSGGRHPKTINSWLSVLRTCLTFALDCGRIETIPRIRWLKVPPPPFDHLNPSESRRLLATATEEPYRFMIHVALRTGMRLGELLALRWECIDLEQRLVLVSKSRTRGEGSETSENAPKNNRIRYIPIAIDLLPELERRRSRGYVFADFFGRPLTHKNAEKGLHRALRAARLRYIGWHSLRHSFATQLTNQGAPLHAVQGYMGHATMQMTLRYAHFAPTAFRSSIDHLATAEKQSLDIVGSRLGSGVDSDPDQAPSRYLG
jgi:integrase